MGNGASVEDGDPEAHGQQSSSTASQQSRSAPPAQPQSSVHSSSSPAGGSYHDDHEDGDTGQELALELFELLPYCNMGDDDTDKLVLNSLKSDNVDFLTVDDKGNSLLMIACQYGLVEACMIMIEEGADLNTKNSEGATPLHFACANGSNSLEVADTLLRHGAKVNAVESSTGCTAMHYAALIDDSDYLKLLLRAGGDPIAEDFESYVPLDYAKDIALSQNIALLTSAVTAKRNGVDAYEAFLDSLSGRPQGKAPALPSGGKADDEIDSLLSELDMDLIDLNKGAATRAAGGNEPEASDSELQDLLRSLFTKEGVGQAVSSKKSLKRSMTAKAVPIFQTAAFEQGAKRAIRAMKDMMTSLQIKCEKLQLQKDQFEKGEKEAIAKLGNLRADALKSKRTATAAVAAIGGVDEEEVASRIKEAVDNAVAIERKKIVSLEEDLRKSQEQHLQAAQQAASEAKGADAKKHAEQLAKISEQLRDTTAKLSKVQREAADESSQQKADCDALRKQLDSAKQEAENQTIKADSLTEQLSQAEAAKAKLREEQASFEANLKAQLQQKATAEIASALEKAHAEVAETMKRLKAEQKVLEKKYLKEQAMRRKFYNELEDLKGKIRVFCRVRPLSGSEKERGCTRAVTCADEYSIGVKYETRGRAAKADFEFDRVFPSEGEGSSQTDVFADTKRLCQSACDGYNVCIFAYGQTGSGKTFTMMGKEEPPELLGVSPRARQELFRIFKKDSDKYSFTCKASMYEIYRSELVDLLNTSKKKEKLYVKTDTSGSVYVENGIVTPELSSPQELDAALESGMATRHVAATLMNSESSRSHLVQIIFIEATNLKSKVSTTGKLTLVDLAGSERADKTGASGDTMEEAKSINQSLSALGNVISALTTGKAHVPYRDSVLTQLMKDCLGGNAKTLMFVNVSPADYNAPETVSSLQFAQRCKTVTNKATASIETAQLKKLKAQLRQLQAGGAQMQAPAAKGGPGGKGKSGPGGRKGPGGAHKKKKK